MPISALSAVSDFAPADLRYDANVFMTSGLDDLNKGWQEKSLAGRDDFRGRLFYAPLMARPSHDWFLREWLAYYGKRQSDLVRDLDWNKARVSLMIRREQQYTRDAVNEVAEYLNIAPHELLMSPDDAMALRRLRADAIRIASGSAPDETSQPLKKVSLR